MKRIELHWQILIAIVLGAICGRLTGTEMSVFGVSLFQLYDFVGTLFLNALSMLMVPLVVSTIIHGVASVGGQAGFGRLGGLTFAYFIITSLTATVIGLVFVIALMPGIIQGVPAGESLGLNVEGATVSTASIETDGVGDIANVFLSMIPTNIVAAAADGQLLGLIVFSLLFGYFMARISEQVRDPLQRLWQGITETMMLITMCVMRFAPFGVFGLVAGTAATTGFAAFEPLMKFSYTVALAMATHVFVIQPLLLKYVGGVSPYRHFRAVAPALLTAFSTASSSATLPVTLECVQKNARVSEKTASLVLPLGATVNMDGVGLYYGAAALFLAQAYGMEITSGIVLTLLLVSVLASVSAPGVPGVPLVLPLLLTTLGLPLESIAIMFSIDRIMDMLRTTLNVFSDTCGAVIIARLQGESGVLEPGNLSEAGRI
jgi:proton glutamate symport protein